MRSGIGFEYFCESAPPLSPRLAPSEVSPAANYDQPISLLRQPSRRLYRTSDMHVIVRELRHRFHHDRELLHARNILDHVKLGPANGNVPEEVQKQIVSGAHPVNVRDRRILGAEEFFGL